MSSGHRQRDVEQQRPLLDGEEEEEEERSPEAEGRLWFIPDCCGMVCAFITWFLVFFADFVVTFVMLLPSRSFWYAVVNGVLFNSLAVLALASHLRTMLTDPVREAGPGGALGLNGNNDEYTNGMGSMFPPCREPFPRETPPRSTWRVCS